MIFLSYVSCCTLGGADGEGEKEPRHFLGAEYTVFWSLVFSALFLDILFLNSLKYKNICSFFFQLKENPVVTQYDSIFL